MAGRLILLGVILMGLNLSSNAQDRTRILFVFDASNSMNGYWEKERKINTATRLLAESVDNLSANSEVELGLRVYGHQTKYIPGKQDCEDTELVVPIGTGRNLIIKNELERIRPLGTTPIARSLELAAGDFDDCEDCRNIIILITDGIEACDGDPCAVSRALQAKGIVLKPFIIGIGIEDQFKATLECVGNFYDAGKEETFKQVLDIVITQALNSTTAQVSLLNDNNEPTESNLPFELYNAENGKVIHDFVHTLNHAGNPDTITLDPLFTYGVRVFSIPEAVEEGFKIIPGEHNILAVPCGQGDLNLAYDGHHSEYADLKCLVREAGECDVINIQTYGSKERYLTGDYDLEIQTIPPMEIKDVNIAQSHTTDIKIPMPGILLLQTGTSGYGGIFYEKDGRQELVKRFTYGEWSRRYIMQPGNYKIIFRSKNAKQMVYTIEKEFTITSGRNTSLSI